MHEQHKTCALPFQNELKELFYDGLGKKTSGYLYGSAATGHWVPVRSDLDLLIFIPEEKLELLGEMINSWKAKRNSPILDGFALFFSQNVPLVKRLEKFGQAARPAGREIQMIDLWNMRNRSRNVFGADFISEFIPEISVKQLSHWAKGELEIIFGPMRGGDVPKIDPVLSKLIWSVSWSARMLMLTRGTVCESKKEALEWLGDEYEEIRKLVGLLLANYSESDAVPTTITAEQSVTIRRFCFELMLKEIRPPN